MASLFPQIMFTVTNSWGQNANFRLQLFPEGTVNIFEIYFALRVLCCLCSMMDGHVALFIADTVP